MPSCVMRYCTNYTGKTSKTQGLTYHGFPGDEERCIQWVDIVRKQRNEEFWQPNKSSKICSVHFKDEDKYMSDKGYILLRKSACPALNLPGVQSKSSSPIQSNLDSILETPREATLKTCVQRLRFQKEKLINKNRNLQKQIKRLRRRVAHLSDILKHFKTKNYIKETKKEIS